MTSTLMSEKIFAFGQRIVAFLWARRFSTLNAPPENLENVSCDPYAYHGSIVVVRSTCYQQQCRLSTKFEITLRKLCVRPLKAFVTHLDRFYGPQVPF